MDLFPIYRIEHFLDAIVSGTTPPEPVAPASVEFYLAKIAGADVQIPAFPISRVDHFLAKICGQNVTLPIPQSREERYLAKIAGEDVEIPPFPINRIDFWLAEWASGSGGQILSVTGVSPLLLENALQHQLISLTQTGKCEQRNLPSGYTETDMTLNGASSYIDTGVVPDADDMEWDCVFYVPNDTNTSLYLLQSRASASADIYGITGSQSGNKINGAFSGTSLTSNIARTAEHTYHVNFKVTNGASTLFVEDLTAGTSDTKTGTYTYVAGSANTYLFGNSGGGSLAAGHGVKSAYIKKSGVLQFNYTACKNSSDVAGFYNSVSGQFVGATSGDFTAGSVSVPSPRFPQSVWCNNGRVVAGNCISNIPDGQGTFITPSELTTTRIYKVFPTDLAVGRNYTVTVTGADWTIVLQKQKPDGTSASNVSGWVTTYAFTPEEGYIYGVAMQKKIGGSAVNITPADFNGTLTLDTTDGKPWTVGTPEVLTVKGINLFDKNTMDTGQGYYVNTTGNIVNGYNANRTVWIPCKPNTKYSYWHTEGAGGCRAFAMNKDTIDTSDSSEWLKGSPASLGKNVVSTVTTPADAVKLYITAARSNLDPERSFDEQLADFMVVEGEITTATAYEPYVTPQTATVPNLFAVGDYKDTQEIISGLLTHKVGVKVFDGTEDWGQNATYNRFTTQIPDMVTAPTTRSLPFWSTHFLTTYSATTNYGYIYNGANNPTVMMTHDAENVTAFKAWLKAQYDAGTPVIVLYPLATPTTETVTAQPLSTVKGTNTVTAVTNVDPVTLTVEYKGRAA